MVNNFICTVFELGFFSPTFTIHRTAGEGEGYSIYHSHPLYRPLGINWVIPAESSPLHAASSRTRPGKYWFPRASC